MGFSFVRSIHMAHIAGFVIAGLGMAASAESGWDRVGLVQIHGRCLHAGPASAANAYVRGDSLAEFWPWLFTH
ncbi:MAG: hypothetical protein R3C44_00855 [Chloroflexota bacterium]